VNTSLDPAKTTRTSTRRIPDPACVAAVDLARAAAVEDAGAGQVGEHVGFDVDAERVVTHYFACLSPAYAGWRWAVTVNRAARAKVVTVAETVLLPGSDALLAPEWLPWSERLRPGDLGVGDLLPTREDDERLVPGYTGADEDPDEQGWADSATYPLVAFELGLSRVRVLSPLGRDDAADRWWSGDGGPEAPIAKAAPASCSTCGFLLLLGGSLRPAFGVCANEYSPSDGRVVSFAHGCGAHSEAAVMPATPQTAPPIVDEMGFDRIPLRPEHSGGSVDPAGPAEDLGHS